MQEYWEKYKKPIDGKPATVAFNADFIKECDNYEYMYVGFVKVALQNPKEDGLICQDEIDIISQIEDRLEMEALRWRVGKYVGMINSDGNVNFIYYLKLDFEWSNAVSEAMKHFAYKYEFGSREDMQCEVYKKLLYPDIYQWQIIHNHNTCNAMVAQGDALEEARAIEHVSFFQSMDELNSFAEVLTQKGFLILSNECLEEGAYRYKLKYYNNMNPHFTLIDEVTLELIKLSQRYNGIYDGWECSVLQK